MEKQRWEESGRSQEVRRSEKRKSGKKVGKSRFTVFFPMNRGSGGSKSNLAKAAGAEPSGQMRDEKVHAVVVRSTFPSQNVQNTSASDHFWKLRCKKCARRCGAKHISKSKVSNTTHGLRPLLEVAMYTTLHYITLHYTTLHYITLHYTTLNCTTLHCTYNYNHSYNYATLHYTTLDYTTLHHPTLHYTRPITPLQFNCKYTTLLTLHRNYNSTTLQLQLHYTTLNPAVVGEVTTETIATTPTNTNPTTFSVNQWIPSAIRDSQQPTSPIGFLS